MNDHAKTARYLIEHGANINAEDWYGRTPLWAAVDIRNVELDGELNTQVADREGALDVIKLLLARGANPNARTRGVTARKNLAHAGGFALVGGFHGTDAVSASGAGG